MAMWRKVVAEFIGTAAFVVIGAGAVVMDYLTGVGLVGIALAHGLAIGVLVSAIAHISGGHINPAVTAGFVATRRLSMREGVWYISAQLLGAVAGAFFLKEVFPAAAVAAVSCGVPQLAQGVTAPQGMLIEGALTFLLVFTVFATAVDPHGAFKSIAGYGIGTVVTMGVLAGGPLTGAAMNPARALGPALASNVWAQQSVYWAGPMLGGVLAALLYHHFFLRGRRT